MLQSAPSHPPGLLRMESMPESCLNKHGSVKPTRNRNDSVPRHSCLKQPPQHFIKIGRKLISASNLEIERSPQRVPGPIRRQPVPTNQEVKESPQNHVVANTQRSVSFSPDVKFTPQHGVKTLQTRYSRPPQGRNAPLRVDTNSNCRPSSSLFIPGVRGPSRYVRFEHELTIPNTPQTRTFRHGIKTKTEQASRRSSIVGYQNVVNANSYDVVSHIPSPIRNYKNWWFTRSPAESRDEITPVPHSPVEDVSSANLIEYSFPWKSEDTQIAVNTEPIPKFWKRADSLVSQGLCTISSRNSLPRPARSSLLGLKPPPLASTPEILEPKSTQRVTTTVTPVATSLIPQPRPELPTQHSFSSRALQTKGSLRRVRRRASDAASDVAVQAHGIQRQVLDRFNSIVFPNKVKVKAHVVSRRSQRWPIFDDELGPEDSFMHVGCAAEQEVSV